MTTTTMPDATQLPPGSPGGNTTEALIMMAEGTQLQRRERRTRSRHQPEMEGRRLMDHVAFEDDKPDEPLVTGG